MGMECVSIGAHHDLWFTFGFYRQIAPARCDSSFWRSIQVRCLFVGPLIDEPPAALIVGHEARVGDDIKGR